MIPDIAGDIVGWLKVLKQAGVVYDKILIKVNNWNWYISSVPKP